MVVHLQSARQVVAEIRRHVISEIGNITSSISLKYR
jgi:hypothetical protein